MDIYSLSRIFWDWSFENTGKIKPNHIALYFFALEHCNRLGWKKTFGFPTTMAMEALGIKSYGTYITTLNDLIEFGFIEMIEKSKNQFSSNIIALPKNIKAQCEALDKALSLHASKQPKSKTQKVEKEVVKGENYNVKLESVESLKDFLDLDVNIEPLHFIIAKGYHNLFISSKGRVKTLTDASLVGWCDVISKMIVYDKVTSRQLVAIKLYLEASLKKERGTRSFWAETIYSINALRKKKDGVHYFDRIAGEVKRWLEDDNEYKVSVALEHIKKQLEKYECSVKGI